MMGSSFGPVEALGVIETATIHEGFGLVDAMAKEAVIEVLAATPLPPGRFLIVIGGRVGEVESSWRRGLALCHAPHDQLFLAEIAPEVVAAARARRPSGDAPPPAPHELEALGLFETVTVSAGLDAADRAVKGSTVTLESLHLARGIAGRSFGLIHGRQDMVEAALALAEERGRAHEGWVGSTLIARP
ncbi:MAG: BMC domain-containing protein, partial [Candidatus Eisenbacteria bacterium]|nr:BMC domain-containing protein [Candidatus Eisenbacteria bacterium]